MARKRVHSGSHREAPRVFQGFDRQRQRWPNHPDGFVSSAVGLSITRAMQDRPMGWPRQDGILGVEVGIWMRYRYLWWVPKPTRLPLQPPFPANNQPLLRGRRSTTRRPNKARRHCAPSTTGLGVPLEVGSPSGPSPASGRSFFFPLFFFFGSRRSRTWTSMPRRVSYTDGAPTRHYCTRIHSNGW